MTDRVAPTPPPLDYGQTPRRFRLRRWMTLVTALIVLLVLAVVVRLALPPVALYFAQRAGIARVEAWYAAARQYVVPEGTILYDESAAGVDAADAAPASSASLTRTIATGRRSRGTYITINSSRCCDG